MDGNSTLFTQEYAEDGWAMVVVPEGKRWKCSMIPVGMFRAFTLPADAKDRYITLDALARKSGKKCKDIVEAVRYVRQQLELALIPVPFDGAA